MLQHGTNSHQLVLDGGGDLFLGSEHIVEQHVRHIGPHIVEHCTTPDSRVSTAEGYGPPTVKIPSACV